MSDPKEVRLVRSFKYRIYPTASQAAQLEAQLGEACRLYNAAVQERREAWRLCRRSVTFYDQSRQLKDIRASGDVDLLNFVTAEKVLRRVDDAFQAFFRRVKAKGTPGYPRYRSARRFETLEFRLAHGAAIRDGRLVLTGLGSIKVKWHRQPTGTAKTVAVRRDGRRWFACVVCDVPVIPLPVSTATVGIDVGLSTFATLSDGSVVENPRHDEAAQKRMRRAQRALARCALGSRRRRSAALRLRQQRAKVARRRSDAQHKAARAVVNRFGYIAVENLNIKGLARARLSKSVHDAAWAAFIDKLTYKAADAGRELVKVNPRGTSQTCLCGADVRKALSVREHACTECGLVAPRDLVSAQIIERLGRSRWTLTGSREAVVHEA